MCGIYGGIFPGWPNDRLKQASLDMSLSILHRGPDNQNFIIPENGVFLGHNRLSIIGLDDSANQPMQSPSGRYSYVFNGEIYNFLELSKKYFPDISDLNSDSFIIGLLFDEIGIFSAVRLFNGMFSIAAFDHNNKTFTLLRDRVGKKPLYFSKSDSAFVFGSEIKSILASSVTSKKLNKASLVDYLSFHFIPFSNTVYEMIEEVPPGGFIEVDASLILTNGKYWNLPDVGNEFFDDNHFEELLIDSVKLRLQSDVPLGVFLSGGIDSGLLVGIASNLSSEIDTYTVEMPGSDLDETDLAAMVASRYSTNHHVIKLENNPLSSLNQIYKFMDEPFGDPSIVPTFLVSQAAAKYCKVVINGEGSDELFGGYRRFVAAYFLSKIDKLPLIDIPFSLFSSQMEKAGMSQNRNFLYHLHRFFRSYRGSFFERYVSLTSDGFSIKELRQILKPEYSSLIFSNFENNHLLADKSFVEAFVSTDINQGMTDCLLTKIDMATMASSIEGRSPFLDYRVVEYAMSIRRKDLFKLGEGRTKMPLRRLAKKYLPDKLINQPKRGFEPPYVQWLKGPLALTARSTLKSSSLLKEMFVIDPLEFIEKTVMPVDINRFYKIYWSLFMLAMWDGSR